MTDQPDPVAATMAYLLTLPTVTEWIGTGSSAKIGEELPSDAEMPGAFLVVSRSGGSGGPGARSHQEIDTCRLDTKSYGDTPAKAAALAMAVKRGMKALQRSTHASVMLLDSMESGGLRDTREPDVEWPMTFGSYLLTYAEVSL